jgi:type I restriction enzyme S subunit
MADKILNSFDVWITAQGWKSRLRLRSIDNVSFEGIDRLRELILEVAILGKLIPQDSSDEDASVLVRKITIERERLIEDGELKKQKLLPEIADEEKHFELPKGWTWVKLGNIGETNIGLTYSPKDVSDRGMPVLRSSNVQNGEISLDDLVRVSSKVDSKNFVENGDLLICARNGSKKLVGKCAIIKDLKERMSFGAFMAIFRSPLNFYIKYFLESPFYRNRLEGVSTTTINQITQDNLKNTLIPLPPLSEQHRIVAKVDELMALCDELEQQETNHLKSHQLLVETLLGTLTQAKDLSEFQTAWATLAQHFDDLFITEDSIDQLKQTILQLAVMGKLVPQDPKDEPASVLLERIRKEKERLVKEVKIKKEKPLSTIAKNEIPFELPEGWAWERLANLTEVITKGSSPKWQGISYTENSSDVLFITSENVGSYKLLLGDRKYVEPEFNKIEPRSILRKGDFLMNIVGGSIGRTAVYDKEEIANINQAVCLIRAVPSFLNESYLLHFFNSEICISYMFDKQVDNARANLSMGNISHFAIPIPPLEEQKRIVSKVNELFALCDRLKDRITEAKMVANLMADAVVELV